jgi:hypothetical protein
MNLLPVPKLELHFIVCQNCTTLITSNVAGLLPQSPCRFACQTPALVSEAWRSWFPSRKMAAATQSTAPSGEKHTHLRARDFAHSPDLWHQPRLADVTCSWSWRICGINLAKWYSGYKVNIIQLRNCAMKITFEPGWKDKNLLKESYLSLPVLDFLG